MTPKDPSLSRERWRRATCVALPLAIGAAALVWAATYGATKVAELDELDRGAATTAPSQRPSAADATLALAESVQQVEDAVAKDQVYREHLAELVAAAPHDPGLQLVSQRLDDLGRHTRSLWRSTMNYAVATCAAGFVPRVACDAYLARLSHTALNPPH